MEFGFVLSQFTDRFDHMVGDAQIAEREGLDSLWLADHLIGIADPSGPVLEAWTALSYVAAITERVRLGHLVNAVSYRNVGLLAKMATTLDIASRGRLELGLGAGWYAAEYEAFGYAYGDGGERRRHFETYVAALRDLLSGATVDIDRDGVRLRSASVHPTGPQRPHPPIVIGAGRQRMLEATGRLADTWNCPAGLLSELERPREIVLSSGRHVRTTIQVPVAVGRTPEEAAAALEVGRQHLAWMGDIEDTGIIGTVDEAMDRVAAYARRGVDGLVAVLPGSPRRPDFIEAYAEVARTYRTQSS